MIWNLLAEGDQQPKGNNAVTYIMLAVFAVLLIGMFVWQSISNKKKQKKAQETVDALKVGDRVKTIGGVCGFIYEINNAENTFVLETGTADKKSYVKFDKGAIYQTAPANGKDEVREVFRFVKENHYELFKMFYEVTDVGLKGGKLVDETIRY